METSRWDSQSNQTGEPGLPDNVEPLSQSQSTYRAFSGERNKILPQLNSFLFQVLGYLQMNIAKWCSYEGKMKGSVRDYRGNSPFQPGEGASGTAPLRSTRLSCDVKADQGTPWKGGTLFRGVKSKMHMTTFSRNRHRDNQPWDAKRASTRN